MKNDHSKLNPRKCTDYKKLNPYTSNGMFSRGLTRKNCFVLLLTGRQRERRALASVSQRATASEAPDESGCGREEIQRRTTIRDQRGL